MLLDSRERYQLEKIERNKRLKSQQENEKLEIEQEQSNIMKKTKLQTLIRVLFKTSSIISNVTLSSVLSSDREDYELRIKYYVLTPDFESIDSSSEGQ